MRSVQLLSTQPSTLKQIVTIVDGSHLQVACGPLRQPSIGIQAALFDEEGAAAEEGVVQQVVQQGGHRWVIIRVVLRAEVLDWEDGVGGDARPLRHL
jgi:hypothetical protein